MIAIPAANAASKDGRVMERTEIPPFSSAPRAAAATSGLASRATDPSVGGFEAVHTATGRGYADRAACIGADREIDELHGDCDGRSAGRPSRHASRCAWIDRRAGP